MHIDTVIHRHGAGRWHQAGTHKLRTRSVTDTTRQVGEKHRCPVQEPLPGGAEEIPHAMACIDTNDRHSEAGHHRIVMRHGIVAVHDAGTGVTQDSTQPCQGGTVEPRLLVTGEHANALLFHLRCKEARVKQADNRDAVAHGQLLQGKVDHHPLGAAHVQVFHHVHNIHDRSPVSVSSMDMVTRRLPDAVNGISVTYSSNRCMASPSLACTVRRNSVSASAS